MDAPQTPRTPRSSACIKDSDDPKKRCSPKGYFFAFGEDGPDTYCRNPYDGSEIEGTRTWRSWENEFWQARELLCREKQYEIIDLENAKIEFAPAENMTPEDLGNLDLKGPVDFKQYQGTWYEIARLPFAWESKCGQAWANYKFDQKRGVVLIRNTCRAARGQYTQNGIGRIAKCDKRSLRITFKEGLAQPMTSIYYVLVTDYTSFAMVSAPGKGRRFLWILSRKPYMDPDLYHFLVDLAKREFAFANTDDLILTGVLSTEPEYTSARKSLPFVSDEPPLDF